MERETGGKNFIWCLTALIEANSGYTRKTVFTRAASCTCFTMSIISTIENVSVLTEHPIDMRNRFQAKVDRICFICNRFVFYLKLNRVAIIHFKTVLLKDEEASCEM